MLVYGCKIITRSDQYPDKKMPIFSKNGQILATFCKQTRNSPCISNSYIYQMGRHTSRTFFPLKHPCFITIFNRPFNIRFNVSCLSKQFLLLLFKFVICEYTFLFQFGKFGKLFGNRTTSSRT